MREISAGAIIYRESKGGREYLVLQYERGHWEFAKGHVEEGESEIETARREIYEETGIARFRIIEGFRETVRYVYRSKKGKLKSKTAVFFLIETRARTVHLSDEHLNYEWLPVEEAVERVTFKAGKTVLRKAEKMLKM